MITLENQIIELVIREAEQNNDAWRLDYDALLQKYIKKAFEMKGKSKERITKEYQNLFSRWMEATHEEKKIND
ncbi:MAG: hypothetical protein MASP_01019 [Candidatus Methanolliviera sp. GoM_asphalt]|nr:MAG: hypothetical protein MASP_01019 [Candidatus Methanolliviera sp. GoM_asphalt]